MVCIGNGCCLLTFTLFNLCSGIWSCAKDACLCVYVRACVCSSHAATPRAIACSADSLVNKITCLVTFHKLYFLLLFCQARR